MTAPVVNTLFVPGTTITHEWLNGVNDYVNDQTASQIPYTPPFTGGVVTTVQDKLSEYVSVKDFGAVGDGVTDDTAAFNLAQNAAKCILIPSGSYVLDNFMPNGDTTFIGQGCKTSLILQKTQTNPAIHILANATVGGKPYVSITQIGLRGATGASVAVLKLEGVLGSLQNLSHCTIDVDVLNTYSPLQMIGDIYNSKIKVTSSFSTTGITSTGTYNIYDFFISDCTNSQNITDSSTSSTFIKSISDGVQTFGGWSNDVLNCVVEGWPNTSSSTAIQITGYYQTFGNIVLTDVPSTKVTNGIACFNKATTLNNVAFRGSVFPTYAVVLDPNSTGCMSNVTAVAGTQPPLEDITSGATLRNWTFSGDCSTFMKANTVRNGSHYHIWDNVVDGFVSGDTLKFGANFLQEDYIDSCIVNLNTTFAALTIDLPTAPVNEQTATISCPSSGITALTLVPTGSTIIGAPSGIAAGTSIKFVYNKAATKWYRI